MSVDPGQDPSDGPNYFNFDDTVKYTFNIDNNQDSVAADVQYEIRFTTQNRPVGAPGGLTSLCPILATGTFRPPSHCRGSRHWTGRVRKV